MISSFPSTPFNVTFSCDDILFAWHRNLHFFLTTYLINTLFIRGIEIWKSQNQRILYFFNNMSRWYHDNNPHHISRYPRPSFVQYCESSLKKAGGGGVLLLFVKEYNAKSQSIVIFWKEWYHRTGKEVMKGCLPCCTTWWVLN